MRKTGLIRAGWVLWIGWSLIAEAGERNLTIPTQDGLQLQAKISYPETTGGRHAGVILIHGSGAGTMDQWMPPAITATGEPARLFLQLAQTLNKAGAVVLRYNKRGVSEAQDGSPQVDPSIAQNMSITHLIQDVQAAIHALRQDPAVDPERIVLLGLSEGTVVGPLAAARDGRIAGLIQMSSQASNLRDLLNYQLVERNMMIASQVVDADRNEQLSPDEVAAVEGFHLSFPQVDRNQDGLVSMNELRAVLVTSYRATLEQLKPSPWYQEYTGLENHPQAVANFPGPILLLHGEADMQTPLSELFMIEAALKGRTNVTIKIWPGLGHGFAPHKGRQGIIPTVGPIETRVLDDLNVWFRETFSQADSSQEKIR